MFKGANGKVSSEQTNTPDKLNRIVEGTHINGDVKTDSNFRIDGQLEGTLVTSGKLVIGVTGKITGKIKCSNADVEGEIDGDIVTDGVLLLKSTAKIKGNITAGKLGVENGADFNGSCFMGTSKKGPVTPIVSNEKEKSEIVQ